MKTKMYSNVGWLLFLLVCCCALPYTCFCYKPGDFVPMAIQTQYHSMRSPWEDVLGHHCPRFGIDKEIVLPIPKPTGYTGSDPYKIALQIGKEKFHTPWLFVIGRLGSEIPMIIVKLKYSAGDLQGAVVKLESMPQQYIVKHEAVMKNYWDINRWPKQILIQYQW
ncbi:hypothetical protein KP509_1Z125200 [Ceratopteris richardii]|nr:hypothetical protein KP509_1Z125200 [Ceratopteris richardii]